MRTIRLLMSSCVVFLAVGAFAQQPTPTAAATPEKSAVTSPAHPITGDQVRQLMRLAHSTERVQEGVHKSILQQQKAMPFFPSAFWTEFEGEMMKIDWAVIATPIYQKYLSAEDGDKAIAFYSTEAGQRALNSATAVTEEMGAKGFDIGKEIGARLGEKYQKEIEENMKKLQEQKAASSPN